MMEEFDRLAWETYRDLAPKQNPGPGKAIVFAISKHHAARLAQYLNELHPEHKGRYAEVITSDVADPDVLIRKFKTETYPMVAVSVGMLDTGFDCREVLHLVLCRRVRSPILYQQMRGRGTRTAPHVGKQKFVIYDFFRNHHYFNDSDTDVFTGTGGGRAPGGPTTPPKPPRDLVELGLEDEWLEAVTYIEVGPEGERVDKKTYVTDWERTIRRRAADDPLLRKVRDEEPLDAAEEEALARRLNQPERFRWSKWRFKSGNDFRDFVRDEVFPNMASLVKDEPQVAEYFRDAVLEIVDPNMLKQVIDELDGIDFKKLGPDVKGDVFEYLLTHLGQSALNGQFRTPRQIRVFMVQMTDPDLGDTIYDPASGTAGFLIDAVDPHPRALQREAAGSADLRRGLDREARADTRRGEAGDPEPPDLPQGGR